MPHRPKPSRIILPSTAWTQMQSGKTGYQPPMPATPMLATTPWTVLPQFVPKLR